MFATLLGLGLVAGAACTFSPGPAGGAPTGGGGAAASGQGGSSGGGGGGGGGAGGAPAACQNLQCQQSTCTIGNCTVPDCAGGARTTVSGTITDTPLADANLARLPRDQSEGHIPKIALTTGQLDALECLLRKVGIADSEFTPEAGTGRVNFYAGGGGTSSFAPSLNGGASFTPVHPWWDSLDNLKHYDIVLHSCEGSFGSFDPTTNTDPMSVKSPAARQALQDFADMGGRVFASHWHVYWFEEGPPAFQSIATFNHRAGLPNPYDATIDQSQPNGQQLAQWMVNVGGSTTPGIVTIRQNASTRTVDAVAGGNTSERWIYASTLTPPSVQYLSATTPIPRGTCGRVVFSDLHVSAGAGSGSDQPNTPFPSGCVTTSLSPQEKVLEFMLFDIASCVSRIVP